jgi:hypothetical protein
MRNTSPTALLSGIITLIALASGALTQGLAHEQHHVECTETTIHAMHADIQAMKDGEAKTTAMKEMEMAKDMMVKKDMDACMAHMHKAMEEIEK